MEEKDTACRLYPSVCSIGVYLKERNGLGMHINASQKY